MNNEELDLTYLSINFPAIIQSPLDKSNYIDAIERYLSDDNKMVFVSGIQGVGKTYLLSEFARKNKATTVSIFVNNRDKSTYDPRNVELDLSNQICYLLNKYELEESNYNTGHLRSFNIGLKRYIKKTNKRIYFLFDGLEHIPEYNLRLLEDVFAQLPLYSLNTYFIFSGNENIIRNALSCISSISSKEFLLPPFSLDETKIYLNQISPLIAEQAKEVYNLTNGVAYKLAFIKRLISRGISVSQIINGNGEGEDFFEYEWKQIDEDNNELITLLSIMAFCDHKFSLDVLAKVSGYTENEIETLLNNISFISVSKSDCIYFQYAHDLYKKYARHKLQAMETNIKDKLLEYYLGEPDNYNKIVSLSSFYENNHRWNEIINILTPYNYNLLLDKNKSIRSILSLTDKGIKASSEINSIEDLFKFSLYKSVLLEYQQMDIWKSEIEAKTKLGLYDEALFLAQSAFMVEDRLKLLSLIARKIKENNRSIESSLIEQIKETYSEVSFKDLKDGVIEIATNLMYSCPKLAIDLVEKTGQVAGGNLIDWALAQISIAIINDKTKRNIEENREDINEEINSRIKNKEIKNLVQGINYFGKYNSVCDILNLIKTVNKAAEKLFFIRNWIKINYEKANTELLLFEAFDIIFKSTEYVVNASVMKDLAIALKNITDKDTLINLIAKFDTLKEIIRQRGPSKDYVIYSLLIAESEFNFNYEKALNRVLEVFYYFIDEIKDIATKSDCLAVFIRKTVQIERLHVTLKSEKIICEAEDYLDKNVRTLISDCAYHYDVLKNIIIALSKINEYYVKIAYRYAEMLNIQKRREFAFHDILSNYLNNDNQEYSDETFMMLYQSISDSELKKGIIVDILDKISIESCTNLSGNALDVIFSDINKLDDTITKCYCYVRAYSIKSKNIVSLPPEYSKSESYLFTAWEMIDSAWDRIEVAFKISSDLSDHDNTLAQSYLDRGVKEKRTTYLDSPKRADILISTIKLAISSFSAIAANNNYERQLFDKINDIINSIPSILMRLILWGELALRVKRNGNDNLAKEIVKKEIRANIEVLSKLDQNSRDNILLRIAPMLFYYHKETAFNDIKKYASEDRLDNIFFGIVKYIETKCTYDEECEADYIASDITYEDLLDCVGLLENINTDLIIYTTIKKIVDIITSRKDKYSLEQKSDIKGKLEIIINNKLPQKLNIKHDGYKVVSLAQLLRINREKFDKWRVLFDEAVKIPNISDRIVVYSNILDALNRTRRVEYDYEKNTKVSLILKEIEKIPSLFESAERLTGFLPILKDINRVKCSQEVSSIFDKMLGNSESIHIGQQKEIIDFAFRLNSELAESLIAKYDSDPSRKRLGEPIKNHYNFLKVREEIFSNEKSQDKISDYPEMCNSLLEALNSNKLSSKPLKELEPFIKKISSSPLSNSLPISLYIVENAIHRHRNTASADTILRRIFDATIFCTELVSYLGKKSVNQPTQFSLSTYEDNHILIHKDEYGKAIKFIKNWISYYEIEDLIIVDQYFSPEELTLVKEFMEINTNINYTILTGMFHNRKIIESGNYEQEFKDAWAKISIERPPTIKIVLVGKDTDLEAPFHDRWWIINRGQSGVRVGTSFNSLGKNKDSEISILSGEESIGIFKEIVVTYAEKNVRTYAGNKLIYKSIYL